MKKNFPVTGVEKTYSPEQRLISSTDLKGAITEANDVFVEVSGFERDELIGKNHNLVRHPDMPPAAFADLWDTIKDSRPWMGIVKNRSKSGDHYWVDAYVTPLIEGDEITGYESVRVQPSRERVRRAERIYEKINAGKSPFNVFHKFGMTSKLGLGMTVLFAAIPAAMLASGSAGLMTSMLVYLVSLALGWPASYLLTKPLRNAAKEAARVVNNPLMQLVYTGRMDEVGQLELTRHFIESRNTTILERAGYSADQLAHNAGETSEAMELASGVLLQQQTETEQVATAMNEMSATVAEVARNTASAVDAANEARSASEEGRQVVHTSIGTMRSVADEVNRVAEAINVLKQDSETISSVVAVISGIAEQTNLLALNAAIEAARAGEQGRGFAVVADEVRSLASRTQESTEEIRSMIEKLQTGADNAVSAMESGRERAQSGVDNAAETEAALEKITTAVQLIQDMNTQIASAAEEQSAVSEEINRNINNINDFSNDTVSSVVQTTEASKQLNLLASNLSTMVHQFR